MNLSPIQNINAGNLNFTTIRLCFLPLWHQPMKYFSHSIRNVSNSFHSFIGFLWVNWNDMFIVHLFNVPFVTLSGIIFFVYNILIIVMEMTIDPRFDFCISKTSLLRFLCKKTQDSRSLFYYTRRHSSVCISNFLRALV